MLMGTTERHIQLLKIAAQMTRRLSEKDPKIPASELVAYAKELDQWVGTVGSLRDK